MKAIYVVLLAFFVAACGFAQTSSEVSAPAVTMKQLMVDLVHPASNEILLSIFRGGPKDDAEWAAVRRSAMALTESGTLLMMRGRARDQGEWAKDVTMLVDAGNAAYKSAQAKDTKALAAVGAPLDASCLTCHRQYRPDVYPRQTSR
jgi:cytochrome c556